MDTRPSPEKSPGPARDIPGQVSLHTESSGFQLMNIHSEAYVLGPQPRVPDVDVLSEVLRAVKLRGAMYFDVTASAPLGATAAAARELAPYAPQGSEHVIEYHVVLRGSCWAGLHGEASVLLEA